MLDQIRQKYPQYKDIPDAQLAEGLYNKFYKDKLSREEFDTKVFGQQERGKTAESEQSLFEQRGVEGNAMGPWGARGIALSGGQIPFGNRITSALGAVGAKTYDKLSGHGVTEGQSLKDLYLQSLADTKATQEANPTETLQGNLTGVATTLPLMFSKALFGTKVPTQGVRGKINEIPQGFAKIDRFVRGGKTAKNAGILAKAGNAGLRGVKGAAVAAPVGAAYGAGEADPGEMLEGAASGAGVAAGVGFASPIVIPAAVSGARKLNTRTIIPNADKIRKKAGELYKLAEQKGGVLKPQFVDDFLGKAEKTLLSDDAVIRSMKANKPLADAFDDLTLFKGQPMTLQRAQALDEQLGDMISANTDMGTVNKVGKRLLDVQSALRESIEQADDSLLVGGREGFEALKEARKLWGASRRMADIERIIQRGMQMQQPANSIKAGFRTLYNNPKRMRGFSEAERAAIKKAAESGAVGDLLSTFGSRLPGVIGAGTGNPMLAGAGYAGSKVARDAAENVQLGRANKIMETIAKDSGLAKTEQRIPIGQMMAKLLQKSDDTIDAGPITDSKRLLEAPRKALPAPPDELVSTRAGVRAMTPDERQAAIAGRQRFQELGLSPDVLKAAAKRRAKEKYGKIWEEVAEAEKRRIEREVEQMWRQNQQPLAEMILKSEGKAKQVSRATGDQFKRNALADALMKAAQTQPK